MEAENSIQVWADKRFGEIEECHGEKEGAFTVGQGFNRRITSIIELRTMSKKTQNTKRKTLIFTLGGKGGVGKTLTLTTAADYLVSKQIGFAAYDCDTENAGKDSAFSAAIPTAGRPNLRNLQDCDKLLTAAAEGEDDVTLADLPANASGDFLEWWDQVVSSDTLEALNLRLVGVGVITPEPGTLASVIQWGARMRDNCNYVISMNQRVDQRVKVTKEQLFPEYYSITGREFAEAAKAREVEIPALSPVAMSHLIKSHQLPGEAAANANIPLLDRARIRTWRELVLTNWDSSGLLEVIG